MDFLVTIHQRLVNHSRRAWASIIAILITVVALFVADEFISTKNNVVLIGYALGNGIGTYIGMSISAGLKDSGSSIHKKKQN